MDTVRPGRLGAFIGTVVLSMSLAQAAPRDKDVNVVNTPDVSVVNTPNVQVTNTPDVSVVNVPTVEIGNSTDNPVPVALQTLKQPFQQQLLIIFDDGVQFAEGAVTIPAGKLLVVENLSAFVQLPFGQKATGLLAAEWTVDGSIQRGHTYMPFTVQTGHVGRGDLFTAAFRTLLFAEEATFRFSRDADASASRVEASVSGYLVDK